MQVPNDETLWCNLSLWLLAGGSSLLPQLRERLEKEMSDLVPAQAKVKVTTPLNAVERRFSSWIGGFLPDIFQMTVFASRHGMWCI